MLPRLSTAKLMIMVAVVALNIAVARALFAFNSEMLLGLVLSGPVLQVALLRTIRSGDRNSAF